MSDHCSACPGRIVWTVTPTGARNPIDYAPSDEGNVLVMQPQGLGQMLSVTLSKEGLELARARGLPLHLSHWATCPEREKFKRS